MIRKCPEEWVPNESSPSNSSIHLLNAHFAEFPFPLSGFQKYAIEAIVTGNDVLVTAHTGSGKTLPAEFAIRYFTSSKSSLLLPEEGEECEKCAEGDKKCEEGSKGPRVIYTSPIKALSNQKFHEFQKMFPDITFGLVTGDIKSNLDASVLIMTTEILQQYLRQMSDNLACVIFDEVHYINDASRGHVWEEAIMAMPSHVQMLMLSATIDAPERFAKWCEECTGRTKVCYVASTLTRVVPLRHYAFIACTESFLKSIKKEEVLCKKIRGQIRKPLLIKDGSKGIVQLQLDEVLGTLKVFSSKKAVMKKPYIINEACKMLKENDLFPAIFFVLSRRQLEALAESVTTDLLEDDSKVPYTIRKECESIVRTLPNFAEYLQLDEYARLLALLEKGIAIHHAGMIPVLREIVETLFAKGTIKVLFATETFAVGINMPTRTVLFTDLYKFDGSHSRLFLPHEYTQMAGRAGRRGIDTVGHVIHLSNLFHSTSVTDYREVMSGNAPKLVSKFEAASDWVLSYCSNETNQTNQTNKIKVSDIHCAFRKSMAYEKLYSINCAVRVELDKLARKMVQLNERLGAETIQYMTDLKSVRTALLSASNAPRRALLAQELILMGHFTMADYVLYIDGITMQSKLQMEVEDFDENAMLSVNMTIDYLLHHKCIAKDQGEQLEQFEKEEKEEKVITVTQKGIIVGSLMDMHGILLYDIWENKLLENLSAQDIIVFLSCFAQVHIQEIPGPGEYARMYQNKAVQRLAEWNDDGQNKLKEIQFVLMDPISEWCNVSNSAEAILFGRRLEFEYEMYLGDFIKAVLSINSMATQLELLAKTHNDLALMQSLREIPNLTLKFIATNISIYV